MPRLIGAAASLPTAVAFVVAEAATAPAGAEGGSGRGDGFYRDFGAVLRQEARRRTACACCQLYAARGARIRPSAIRGACAFEEVLLPTFARQHYPQLLPRAAPPTAWRLWLSLQDVHKHGAERQLWALADEIRRNPADFAGVFSFKVPHALFPQIEAAMCGALAPEWAASERLEGAEHHRLARDACPGADG